MNKVGVVGLGYVGLPLALLAEKKGYKVIGIDLDKNKLSRLRKHKTVIDDETANEQLANTKITFTDDFKTLADVDIAVVCVPTPIDQHKNPNLNPVKNASLSAAKELQPGSLLIIESTINPGVCDEVIIPLIEKETDHTIGSSLHIAHCPERINPGDKKWHVGNINRVLGSSSKTGLEKASKFYEDIVDARIMKMATIKEAEAVKVVENSFRDINIAFVNELAMSFAALDINVKNVIDGAATKPFAFMPHYPGIGVGGHCIPVDPYYLIEYAKSNGFDHKFLSLARNINESMPIYAIDVLEETLIRKIAKPLAKCRVGVLGLSYKANVGDDRESPAYVVIKELERRGTSVVSYDPYISTASTEDSLGSVMGSCDALILVTAHQEFIDELSTKVPNVSVFLDGRNALHKQKVDFENSGVAYIGIGL